MFKIIAISLITIYFLFQLFLNILKYRNRNSLIPHELADVYDETTYLKWKSYSAEHIKINIISSAINYLIIILIISTNCLFYITQNISNVYLNAIITLLVYLGIDTLTSVIFSYVKDIKIEGKYGFNRSTTKTFVLDQIKGLIVSLLLMVGLSSLFILIHQSIGDFILIVFTAIIFIFSIFMFFLYPFLVKLFNKFVSLPDGELRTSLINMLESHRYHVRDIKVMDASRRTSKSNAYFTGFGKSKTIVLYDNLLKVMDEKEILSVFAHEMGHGLHKDTLKSSILSLFSITIYVLLAWLLVKFPNIYNDFGYSSINYGFAGIILINILIPVASTILGILTSFMSRIAEYKADEQAFKEGYGPQLISALKKLSKDNLVDLNPHPLIVILSYSHPTLLQRIRHINELSK